jgi:hypothetical protein
MFFLVFYLAVRLLFMEKLDAAVAEANVHSIGDIMAHLSTPLLIFVIWSYSFRVGMFLAIIGGALHAGMGRRELRILVAGGGVYLVSCYVSFVGYSPGYYGTLGTAILVMFVGVAWNWTRKRPTLSGSARIASDLRMVGHYFLVVATWSLCGIFGIVTYALQPQIMLTRRLQPTALMLTSHVMAELAVGWCFVFLASRKEPPSGAAAT